MSGIDSDSGIVNQGGLPSGISVATVGLLPATASNFSFAIVRTGAGAGVYSWNGSAWVLIAEISSGGTVTGSGTAGKLVKFTAANVIGNSIITEAGSVISVAGDLSATGQLSAVNILLSALSANGLLGTNAGGLLSIITALPSGTTAVTQTLGDNTTLIATTAFVQAAVAGGGGGSVTTVSVVTANGVSGSVSNPTTNPAITIVLGAITPSSVNGASAAEVAFLIGVTSNIQTQLNAKGIGNVTAVTIVTANGVSGSVANQGTTPAITISLGAITPTSVNGASAAEIAFLIGVTSNIQTQLNAKGPGTVTAVTIVTANGVSGSVANQGTTPAITISLGAITPSSIVASGNITAAALIKSGGTNLQILLADGTTIPTSTYGAGTVTQVTIVPANGVSGSVANQGTTPAITISLGAITPSSIVASGNITAAALIKSGGTASQVLLADGTVTTLAAIVSNYLPLSGGTLTGNLTIFNNLPILTLNHGPGGHNMQFRAGYFNTTDAIIRDDTSGKNFIGFDGPTGKATVFNDFDVGGSATLVALVLSGSLTIPLPTTSAGSYNILTRNSSTGVVEKLVGTFPTSGNWTPTLSALIGGATALTVLSFSYIRVGSQCMIAGSFTCTPGVGSNYIGITLPSAAPSTFASANNARGTVSSHQLAAVAPFVLEAAIGFATNLLGVEFQQAGGGTVQISISGMFDILP